MQEWGQTTFLPFSPVIVRFTLEMQKSGLTLFLREFITLPEGGLEQEVPLSLSRGESIFPPRA